MLEGGLVLVLVLVLLLVLLVLLLLPAKLQNARRRGASLRAL